MAGAQRTRHPESLPLTYSLTGVWGAPAPPARQRRVRQRGRSVRLPRASCEAPVTPWGQKTEAALCAGYLGSDKAAGILAPFRHPAPTQPVNSRRAGLGDRAAAGSPPRPPHRRRCKPTARRARSTGGSAARSCQSHGRLALVGEQAGRGWRDTPTYGFKRIPRAQEPHFSLSDWIEET